VLSLEMDDGGEKKIPLEQIAQAQLDIRFK
jgi:hypothetical protein